MSHNLFQGEKNKSQLNLCNYFFPHLHFILRQMPVQIDITGSGISENFILRSVSWCTTTKTTTESIGPDTIK